MPTVFSHPAIALAAIPCLRGIRRKYFVVLYGAFLTILPDVDVIAFRFGIPYDHMLGHRGITHSIIFAFLAASLFAIVNKQPNLSKNLLVWGYFFICALSHGLLDAATNGGRGVSLFLPFSSKRFFFEYRPIIVSPLSIDRFLNGQGTLVLQNEILYVWLPAICVFILVYGISRLALFKR